MPQYKRKNNGSRRPMFRYADAAYNGLGMSYATARAIANRYSGSRTQTQQRKRTTSGGGVTVQHDVKRIYRKKSMPRRKKKLWKKFVSKVNAVDERDLGSHTALFSSAITVNTITDTQLVTSVGLYTNTSTSTWLADMKTITGTFNVTDDTKDAGGTIYPSTKIIFKSAVLDITVRNTSNNNAGGSVDCPMEVDVYEISLRGGNADSTVGTGDLIGYLQRGASDTLNEGGLVPSAGSLDIFKRGCTPWELPAALSMYRMKIWKKTKYFLTTGQTFTYQMRDPKRHVMSYAKMQRTLESNINGLTKWILFIGKATPGIVPSETLKPQLSIGVTRKYLWKVEGFNEDRDFYFKD